MTPSIDHLLKHGSVGAIGLLLAGFAFETYHWYGYMKANPATGTISTSPGFRLVTAAMFVVGVTIAYVAFARGLRAMDDDASTSATSQTVSSTD